MTLEEIPNIHKTGAAHNDTAPEHHMFTLTHIQSIPEEGRSSKAIMGFSTLIFVILTTELYIPHIASLIDSLRVISQA